MSISTPMCAHPRPYLPKHAPQLSWVHTHSHGSAHTEDPYREQGLGRPTLLANEPFQTADQCLVAALLHVVHCTHAGHELLVDLRRAGSCAYQSFGVYCILRAVRALCTKCTPSHCTKMMAR